MKLIVADFETYFSDDFTLKKLSTEAYIRDPRFEAHGCAFREPDGNTLWVNGADLRGYLTHLDETFGWANIGLICWHAQFDGLIFSHHFNVKPKFWFCPMSMSRLLIGNHISVSLDSIRSHFGIAPKTTPYNLFRNKHWHELTPYEQDQVAKGAIDEVESIWKIFNILAPQFPVEELECIDLTVRMFTEPVLRADVNLLAKVWEGENDRKQSRLADLGIVEPDVQSADRFAALLREQGVEPETKEGKNGPIYAFAKTDSFMRELQESDDEIVCALAEARLGAKSTLVQTRAETLGWMAQRGPLCVYLRYCGAHTTRWSGGDNANWQNSVPALNEAILAPDDFLIASPDSSQVECRCLNFLAGQEDKIEDFRQGRDPYVGVAEAFCGHPVNKKDHPDLRQAGKVVELQAGYGSGAAKIKATMRNKAGITISDQEAEKWKDAYRNSHPAVTQYWRTASRIISRLAGGPPTEWGPMHVKDGRIWLPNGCPLIYETLNYHREENGDEYWRLKTRNGWVKIYGSKLVENVVQALARVIVSQAMIRISRLGYRIFNMRHDDIGILIPKDGKEEMHLEACLAEMRRTPAWLPGIPLDAEGSLSERYTK